MNGRFATLTARSLGTSNTTRWEGRERLIVPVVLAVGNTVVNQEYISTEVLSFSSQQWAGRPVTLPSELNGTALTPDKLETLQIGVLFYPQMSGNLLRAEAWLDKAKCEDKGGDAKEIYDRSLAGDQLQTRLGVFAELILSPGSLDGNSYTHKWGHRLGADHVAILLISIEDSTTGTVAGVNLASGYRPIDTSLPLMRAATSDTLIPSFSQYPSGSTYQQSDSNGSMNMSPRAADILANRDSYIDSVFSQLSSYRKEAGLTQQELAARVRMSQATVSKWEDGSVTPSFPVRAAAVHAVLSACVQFRERGLKALSDPPPELRTQHEQYASLLALLFTPVTTEEEAARLLASHPMSYKDRPAPDPISIKLGRDLRAEARRYVLDLYSDNGTIQPVSLGSGYKSQPAPDPYAERFGRDMFTGKELKRNK